MESFFVDMAAREWDAFGMRLEKWLAENSMTVEAFRKELGVQSVTTTYRYINGDRIPLPDIMHKISEITGGQVTPNDFYGIE